MQLAGDHGQELAVGASDGLNCVGHLELVVGGHPRAGWYPSCSGTMASILDSKVEFRKRCEELMGPDQTTKLTARARHRRSLRLLRRGPGGPPLRREAYGEGVAHSCHDARLRSEADSVASRPVPAFEREAKRTEQVRLKGLLLEGELEPAHALIDKCAARLHDGAVRYLQ